MSKAITKIYFEILVTNFYAQMKIITIIKHRIASAVFVYIIFPALTKMFGYFITTTSDVFAHASYKCPVNNCFEWAWSPRVPDFGVLSPGSWVLGLNSQVPGSRSWDLSLASRFLGPRSWVAGLGSWVLSPGGPRSWVLILDYFVFRWFYEKSF